MAITTDQVKELRQKTGIGIMDCKRALQEADGDMKKARQILREEGLEMSEGGPAGGEGRVESYIHHNGKIGVLVEINSQTDFTANSDEFREFATQVARHIAAAAPKYVSREHVPEQVVEEEREIYRKQAEKEGKPKDIIDQIVDGKLDKYYEENCLMEQEFVGQSEDDETIEEMLGALAAQVSETIEIKRFARFEIGSDQE
ncbi:MAG: translation elongation factor Ts [Candidatus Bipolaricaulota bacterium]